SPVAGLSVSNVLPEAASTHLPSISMRRNGARTKLSTAGSSLTAASMIVPPCGASTSSQARRKHVREIGQGELSGASLVPANKCVNEGAAHPAVGGCPVPRVEAALFLGACGSNDARRAREI